MKINENIYPFIAPYDSSSKKALTSNSVLSWKKIIPSAKAIERQLAGLIPYIVYNEIKRCSLNNKFPLLIGGDHSLTYFSIKALTSLYGKLNILVFDAHHDAYKENYINHYSFFHHIKSTFGASILTIGCRKDPKDALIDIDAIERLREPCYISLDLDFFSPRFVPTVMDPVLCDKDNDFSLTTFISYLNKIQCDILGFDIVEWGGADSLSQEFCYVKTIAQEVIKFIEKKLKC